MNYITPLNKVFPTRLGPGGLDMARGEGGASWYWWGHSKSSWNHWDQSSDVAIGEAQFESEFECYDYAKKYWDARGYLTVNNGGKFLSICDMFSSKNPCSDSDTGKAIVSNATCRAACDSRDNSYDAYFADQDLLSDKAKLAEWFSANCMYTPYQAENDHAWPNFHVADNNECFAQWQIGYEDQGCDGCLHPRYDNSADFNYGWSYGPVEGSSPRPKYPP